MGVGEQTDIPLALLLGVVMSGAMFGDNLSMISDTTIAAVRTQGCEMKDKFRMNFLIVLPAAIITLLIFVALTWGGSGQVEVEAYSFWKVLPYLVVLMGALIGVNVFVILMLGTALSLVVGVASGAFAWTQVFAVMGTGVTSMYDITVISIIVACIGALVKEHGGIQWLIEFIHRRVKSKKGAQLVSPVWWPPWTWLPPTTPWPSLCPAPLPRRSARSTISTPAGPPPCWTSSPR